MKRERITTILWMVVFAAAAFCLIPIALTVMIFLHVTSNALFECVVWLLRLVFIASPIFAWFLGSRGLLPGTKPLAITERGTDNVFRALTLVVVVIVMVFLLGAWVAFLPAPGRPNVSITLLGYTNDATGARVARIAVTNRNATTIFVYAPRVEIQAPADSRGYEDYFSGNNCSWSSTLANGTSGNFTIPPPTNQSPWRLSFWIYPDRGRTVKNRAKYVVSISCLGVGLWPRFMKFLPLNGAFRMPYAIEGDWIENDK